MKTQIKFKYCLTRLRGQMLNLGYHSVVTMPLRCGLHRTLTMLLLLLCIGVGNAWGAIAAGTYEICTSTSDLVASGHYIIASSKSNGTAYAIANTSKSDNRATVSVTVASEKITIAANSTVMTFTLGGDNTNGWTFSTDNYAGTAGMLAATSSTNNRLGVVASPGNNGKWDITFSSGLAKPVAKGTNSRKYMKYNYNNGTPIFNCYSSSGSESVYIYKLAASCDDITPTLSYTSTNLTIGGGNSSSPTLNKDGSSGAVTWSSDDEDVATVNSSGVVTPVGTGTCNITASIAAAGGKCAGEVSVEFTVTRTITYYVGSTSYTVGGIDGETLVSTLPASPTSCDATNYPYFIGWKNGSISGSTTTKPTILSTEVVNSTTAANTYYAVFADKAGSTTEYTFTSNSWAATSGGSAANWTNGAAGNGFTSGQGNQITTGKTGANATSPVSFTNVTNVLVTYNTNKSAGAGSVVIKIGDNTEVSNNVSYSGTEDGTSANFTSEFNFSPAQTGNVKLTVNCTTNSIWLKSIAITTGASGTAHYITTCCTPLGQINGPILLTQQNRLVNGI